VQSLQNTFALAKSMVKTNRCSIHHYPKIIRLVVVCYFNS
jgi:hypothetical protein